MTFTFIILSILRRTSALTFVEGEICWVWIRQWLSLPIMLLSHPNWFKLESKPGGIIFAAVSNTFTALSFTFSMNLFSNCRLRYKLHVLCFLAVILFVGKALTFLFFFFQFSSVTQSCLTLGDPMNRSMPGLPVQHKLLQFTQTHAHQVGDAIQPSHPLSSPSPPAPNPSQHQGLFQ